eukprot:301096-Chlamydomonas_euryale.AAC.1
MGCNVPPLRSPTPFCGPTSKAQSLCDYQLFRTCQNIRPARREAKVSGRAGVRAVGVRGRSVGVWVGLVWLDLAWFSWSSWVGWGVAGLSGWWW